ncbi:restriction endonuclease subunit S [Flagellimonas sp.]|jgi:type I restriction enzyme S subunit|uniref:restriction endonuclease subunit S n=1 Tax=Flagellimonas sp. TaxID=2058762 RepID=UPI003AB8460B
MIEVKSLPQLRFTEFENGWIPKKYDEIYSFYSTNSFSRDKLNYESGKVKNIHYGDIHTKFSILFDISKEIVPFVNDDIIISNIPSENYCQEGDLLIADASEDYKDIGKTIEIVNLDNEKVLAGLHTFLARPNKHKMAVGFAGFMLQYWGVREQVMKIAQGTKVLGLAKSRLAKIKLNIPSFPEQQKIASFLTAVDDKITQLTKKKALLEQYKKAAMQRIFNQEIRFKDDEGKDYPEWEKKSLGKLTKYYDGTHQTPNYVAEGIPFYSVEHVTANQFDNTKYISSEVFEKENKRVKLEKGDILMTRIGNIGQAKYIDWDVKASFYVSLALIKQNINFSSKYLSQYINSSFFQHELWKRTIHVAFPQKINLGEIGQCLVDLPCFDEQTKIANFLSAIDHKIILVDSQIEKTTAFKKGLLQQMFV